jgi:hypothetical protein
MKEELISFETAKLAKEKGFDDVRVDHLPYMLEGEDEGCIGASIYCKVYANCCTQSILQKWLREVHDIHIQVFPEDDVYLNRIWATSLFQLNYGQDKEVHWLSREKYTKSYEDALEVGLQEALKRI